MATIFQDDFNRADSTNLGPDWVEVVGDWAIAANQLHIVVYSNPMQCSYVNSISTADYAVQAFCHTGINPKRNPGVFGRGVWNATTGRYDCYYATVQPDIQTVYLYLYQNGSFSVLASTVDTSIDATGNTGYTIRLEMQGTTLKVFVDGVEKLSVTDSTLTSGGYCGVMAGSARTSLYWDDFLVEDFTGGGTTYDQPMDFASATLFDVVKTAMYGRSLEYSASAKLFLDRIQKLSRQFEYNARAKLELSKIAAIYESLEFKSDVRYETTNKQLLNRGIKFVAKPILDAKRFLALMNSLSYLTYANLDIENIKYIFNEFDFSAITEFDIRKWAYYERSVEFKAIALLELLSQQAGAIRATLSFVSGTAFSIGRVMNITRSLEAKVNTILELTKSITGTINLYLDFTSGAKLEFDTKQKRFAQFVAKSRTNIELYAYRVVFKSVAFYAKTLLQIYKSRHLFRKLQAKSFAKYNNSRLAKFFKAFGAKAHAIMKLVTDTSAPDVIVKYIGAAIDGGEFQSITEFIDWIETNHPNLVDENIIIVGKIVSLKVDTDVNIENITTDSKRYVKLMPASWVSKPSIVHNPTNNAIGFQLSSVDFVLEDLRFLTEFYSTSSTKSNYVSIKRCIIDVYYTASSFAIAAIYADHPIDVYNTIVISKAAGKAFANGYIINFDTDRNRLQRIFNNTLISVYDTSDDVLNHGIFLPTHTTTSQGETKYVFLKNNLCYNYNGLTLKNFVRAATLGYYGDDRNKTVYFIEAVKNIVFESDRTDNYIENYVQNNHIIRSFSEKPEDYVLYPVFNNSPVGNKNMMAQGEDLSAYFDDDFTGRKRKKGNYDIGAIAEIHPDNVSKLFVNKIIPFARKRVDKLLRSDKQKVTLDKKGNAYYVSLSFKSNNN